MDRYLRTVIKRHEWKMDEESRNFINQLKIDLRSWAIAQGYNEPTTLTYGSVAKDTCLKGRRDIDILLSLDFTNQNITLRGMFKSVSRYLGIYTQNRGFSKREQNVSIRIYTAKSKIDIIPAKRGNDGRHSLYFNHDDKNYTSSNISETLKYLKGAKLSNEIKLLKIWRNLHGLNLPSILAELIVINVLSDKRDLGLTQKFEAILRYLSTPKFLEDKYRDPGNNNNIISASVTKKDKERVKRRATECLNYINDWPQIVW